MKAHILIVEDEAILYERLRMALVQEHYSVDEYSPSVNQAIKQINNKRPDLVLLDIDLKGKETGLDLGERLHKEFKIPFIYVTQYDDDETFYKGLNTQHEDFVVKTKPHMDSRELLRKIQTVLNRYREKAPGTKEGVMGLTKYKEEIRSDNHTGEITKVPVAYDDILYFSTFRLKIEGTSVENVRTNYIVFKTRQGKEYFMNTSLTNLLGSLPHHFCRINDKTIANLSEETFNGRINGARLVIGNEEFIITPTYKNEVKKRIDFLYES